MKRKDQVRHGRESKSRKLNPPRFLIVSEGTKTEPNYFKGLKNQLSLNNNDRLVYKNIIPIIEIDGKGYNTVSLVEAVLEIVKKSDIEYEKVFCVFDKDSFPNDDFNNAVFKCYKNKFIPLYSNECFELWVLLHFHAIESALGRKDIYKKLDHIFKTNRIDSNGYLKNNENLYEILTTFGDQEKAIKQARKLDYMKSQDYANHNPVTKIYELIEELNEYLK